MAEAAVASHWTIDKRIPVAALLTVIVQTGVMIWWAASVEARVNSLEQGQDKSVISRLVAVETKLDVATINFGVSHQMLESLDSKMDQVLMRDDGK